MRAIEEKKGVLVIDSELPIGIIANTAAILGITLGYTLIVLSVILRQYTSLAPHQPDKKGGSRGSN